MAMEFELRKRRHITDEEYILDMQSVAKILGKNIITIEEYEKHGKYHSSSLRRRFGNWAKCLSRANLNYCKIDYSDVTKEDFINDIQRVAKEHHLINLTGIEYDKHGKYNHSKITRVFKTWNNALKASGLFYKISKNLTEEELFDNLLNVWQKLGRQPYYHDMHQPLSICSAKPYVTKYGSWYNALEKFVAYMNKDEDVLEVEEIKQIEQLQPVSNEAFKHKTSRNINLRLRYKVLKRDNFKCVICGRSPAKDQNIELHVDHIIPYSKGGETVIENLRTLCSDCNLGKSNLL